MKEITVAALMKNMQSVVEFINKQLIENNMSQRTIYQIDVAVDEVFSNIVCHAYKNSTGNVKVCVGVKSDSLELVICFIDRGIPFNPITKLESYITLSANKREIDGSGILMVKRLVDKITYDYMDNKNVLKLYKRI